SSFIGATKCFWASYRKAICGVTALNPSGLGIFSGTPPTEMSVDQLREDERRRNVRMINLMDLSVMLEMGGERIGRLWAVCSMGMAVGAGRTTRASTSEAYAGYVPGNE